MESGVDCSQECSWLMKFNCSRLNDVYRPLRCASRTRKTFSPPRRQSAERSIASGAVVMKSDIYICAYNLQIMPGRFEPLDIFPGGVSMRASSSRTAPSEKLKIHVTIASNLMILRGLNCRAALVIASLGCSWTRSPRIPKCFVRLMRGVWLG